MPTAPTPATRWVRDDRDVLAVAAVTLAVAGLALATVLRWSVDIPDPLVMLVGLAYFCCLGGAVMSWAVTTSLAVMQGAQTRRAVLIAALAVPALLSCAWLLTPLFGKGGATAS